MADLTALASEVRRYDRDRFLCSLFAPADRRDDLLALYAFNAALARVRETVTEPLLGEIRLQWWRDSIAAIYDGKSQHDPTLNALSGAVGRRGLSRPRLEKLIDGRSRDLDDRSFETLDALIDYTEATSSSLIAVALEVLGAGETEAVREAGRHVGIAWALIGLLRAIPYHSASGRRYLPDDVALMVGMDLSHQPLRQGSEPLGRAIARVAQVAVEHLTAARRYRGVLPRSAVAALLPATLADSDLKTLARCDYDPFDARVQSGGGGRLLRLWMNALRGRF